jgi:hypothetical protein
MDSETGAESIAILNGKVLSLQCEGLCSDAYKLERKSRIGKLRAAGWSQNEIRSNLSSMMVARGHYESRRLVNKGSATVVVFYTCLGCGHERQYGVEEL